MTVAHVMENFSLLSETFLYDYVTGLHKQGVRSPVYTFTLKNLEDRPHEPIFKIAYPPSWHPLRIAMTAVRALPIKYANDRYNRVLYRRQLRKALERDRPDVIHAHLGRAAVLVAPVARRLGIPMVASLHGKDAFALPFQERWKREFERMFASAAVITVVSRLMESHIAEIGVPAERLEVVRVGKSVNAYPWRAPQAPVRRWVSVGRFTEKKGFEDCIRAFDLLARDDPHATLEIVGDGPLAAELHRLAATVPHGHRVKWAGSLPHPAVVNLMRESDAFILCSKEGTDGDREGVPTVLMEAQALGLPCVSTLHSGIPEVIPDEGQRFLANPGDVESIHAAMASLASQSSESLGALSKAGRKKIEEEFNLADQVVALKRIYERLRYSAPVI